MAKKAKKIISELTLKKFKKVSIKKKYCL